MGREGRNVTGILTGKIRRPVDIFTSYALPR